MKVKICNHIIDIDKEFLTLIKSNHWSVRTNTCGQIYFDARINGEPNTLHRIISQCPSGMVVDHINGDTLDNKMSNLRICTKLQNQYNQKKHKGKRHSKYKGVTFRKELKSKPWEAFIYKDYKSKRLGYFATEKEAALAYNEAAKESYGEFAKLNELEG